jgi:hypothetical protein
VPFQDTKGLYNVHVISFYVSLFMVLIVMLLLLLSFIYSQARFFEAAVAYKKKIGFKGTLLFNLLQCSILDQLCDYMIIKE